MVKLAPEMDWTSYAKLREDLDVVYALPATNFLQRFWTPLEVSGKMIAAPIVYVAGMVGFALCVPFRVARLVGRAFFLLGVFFLAVFHRFDEKSVQLLKERATLLLISGAKLLMIPVAILCPLAGYYFEEKLNMHLPESDWTTYFVFHESLKAKDAYHVLGLKEGEPKSKIQETYYWILDLSKAQNSELKIKMTIQWYDEKFQEKGLTFYQDVFFKGTKNEEDPLTESEISLLLNKMEDAYNRLYNSSKIPE